MVRWSQTPTFFLQLPKRNKSKTLKYLLGQILKVISVSSRKKCLAQEDQGRREEVAEDWRDRL